MAETQQRGETACPSPDQKKNSDETFATTSTTMHQIGQIEQTFQPTIKQCKTSDCPVDKKVDGEPFPTATQYVIITKNNIRENVQRGDHLAYTMSSFGFTYWHEVFVVRCNWEKYTLTVYERVRIPEEEKGFRRSEFWINNLWDQEKLCKKYIYEEGKHLPLKESFERAKRILKKDEEKRKKNKKRREEGKLVCNFELYEVFSNNCEHTVRSLKTGNDESLQIKEVLCCMGCRGGCSCVPKCLKILNYILRLCKAPVYAIVELVIDNICDFLQKRGRTCPNLHDKLDTFNSKVDFFKIGIEIVWGVLLCVLWWIVWEIVLQKTYKEEIDKDNWEDELSIMRHDMLGFFLGLVVSFALVIGLHFVSCNEIFLLVVEFALYLLVNFCFSNMLRNWAFSKVRKKHQKKENNGNKKEKYRQVSRSAPALIAIRKELQSAGSAPVLLMKHEDEANRQKYLQSAPGLIINDSPV